MGGTVILITARCMYFDDNGAGVSVATDKEMTYWKSKKHCDSSKISRKG